MHSATSKALVASVLTLVMVLAFALAVTLHVPGGRAATSVPSVDPYDTVPRLPHAPAGTVPHNVGDDLGHPGS
jgi:hypothetical protein